MNKMAKRNKKSKKCQTFLILLIIGIVILLGSIPLYIVGINKMNKQIDNSAVGQIDLDFNAEEIIALCMSSLGMLMTVMFGLMYASCKK
tara:strand:- start:853 stop:1119 length:267 start_codon:yes stop_codon:yes gene_type:complete